MGSAGIGSISHLTLLLFKHLTGADVVHVPYRGLSEASNDLLGGQIDTLFDQVVTATPHILNDSENAIVVTDPAARAFDPESAVGERSRGARSANRRLDRFVHAQGDAGADRRAHQRRACRRRWKIR